MSSGRMGDVFRADGPVLPVDEDLRPVDEVAHLGEYLLAVVIDGQAHQVADDAHQALLEAGSLVGRHLDGLLVQVDDLVVQPQPEHRLFRGEEAFPGDVLGQGTFEADPVLLPAGRRVGPVGMPFSREQDEHRPAGDRNRGMQGGAAENALPFRDVEDLELVQDPPTFFREQIAGRVSRGGIGLAGTHDLGTHGIDG